MEQNREHMAVIEVNNGKLLRLIADEGYILRSKNGRKFPKVLTDPKRAESWTAVPI